MSASSSTSSLRAMHLLTVLPDRKRLHYALKGGLEPQLLDKLRSRREGIIQILLKDEEMRRTGIIQSEAILKRWPANILA